MRSFGWLHLTDLHQGQGGQGWLWPNVREILFDDLEKLHDRCGPWDVVLFTGDLTQRGSKEEFDQLSRTLRSLWDHLRRLGSTPSLLTVPGNHDLTRPDPRRPETVLLSRWAQFPEIQAEFWADPDSVYRKFVREAFANYSAWATSHPFCSLEPAAGLLPGDFSTVLERGELRLGIVGLNTSFLQLTDNNYEGKLAVDVRQFHAACGGDGPAWLRNCDIALVMTHHPPEWLSPSAREHFFGEVVPPGRFAAHLFGHMHEHMSTALSIGGSAVRRQLQGSSLFGLETFGDGKLERRHGYTAGRIDFDEQGEVSLRLWPRAARRHAAGHWRIVQDLDAYELGDDQATRPEVLPRLRRPVPPPPPPAAPEPRASASQTAPIPDFITSLGGGGVGDSGIYFTIAARIQPPGAPYNQSWHIARAEEERTALNYLDQPGAPVVLWGPEKFGKTWSAQFLTHCVMQQDGGNCRVIAINLDTFDHESRADYPNFIRELAFQIVGAIGGPEDWVPTLWRSHGSVNQKLGRLMRENVLPLVSTRVVMALDRVDAVWGLVFKDDFFGMLRAWAQDSRLEKLRFILGISTTPRRLIDRPTQSPFNLTPPIVLGDFNLAQIQALATLYELDWSEADFHALTDLVGGHPYLVRHAMHRANMSGGIGIDELFDDGASLFDDFLQRYARRLHNAPELLDGMRRLHRETLSQLDPEISTRLEAAGLAVEEEVGFYRLRYRLYERLRL